MQPLRRSSISFLDLPVNIRTRIYEFSDLVHGCPLELVRSSRSSRTTYPKAEFTDRIDGSQRRQGPLQPQDRSCLSTLQRGLTSGMTCTYMGHLIAPYPDYIREEEFMCFGLPPSLSLLLVCRTIHLEALATFYSKNQFKLTPSTPHDLQAALRGVNPVALAAITSFHIDLTDPVFEVLDGAGPWTADFVHALQSMCEYLASVFSRDQLSSFSLSTNAKDPQVLRMLAACLDSMPPATNTAISLGSKPAMRELARSISARLSTSQHPNLETNFPFFSLPKEIRLEILGLTSLVPKNKSIQGPNRLTTFSGRNANSHNTCCTHCTTTMRPCCCLTKPAAWSGTCTCELDFRALFLVCRQLRDEAYYVLGSQNSWRLLALRDGANEMLHDNIPPLITGAIRRIELRMEKGVFRQWCRAVSGGDGDEDGKGLREWEVLLRTIREVVDVANLDLYIDVGWFEHYLRVQNRHAAWGEDVRREHVKGLRHIRALLGEPKTLWIKGRQGRRHFENLIQDERHDALDRLWETYQPRLRELIDADMI